MYLYSVVVRSKTGFEQWLIYGFLFPQYTQKYYTRYKNSELHWIFYMSRTPLLWYIYLRKVKKWTDVSDIRYRKIVVAVQFLLISTSFTVINSMILHEKRPFYISQNGPSNLVAKCFVFLKMTNFYNYCCKHYSVSHAYHTVDCAKNLLQGYYFQKQKKYSKHTYVKPFYISTGIVYLTISFHKRQSFK